MTTTTTTPALVELLHLLDGTADDRWAAGHPSTRPRLSPEDRIHDAMRPNDPTADAVTDPARLALAATWRSAMDHVHYLLAFPPSLRSYAIGAARTITELHVADLRAAHAYWLGDQ